MVSFLPSYQNSIKLISILATFSRYQKTRHEKQREFPKDNNRIHSILVLLAGSPFVGVCLSLPMFYLVFNSTFFLLQKWLKVVSDRVSKSWIQLLEQISIRIWNSSEFPFNWPNLHVQCEHLKRFDWISICILISLLAI